MSAMQNRVSSALLHIAPCPSCQGGQGKILGASIFSESSDRASMIALEKSCGAVYRCKRCHLVFRFPMPTPQELARAYEDWPVTCWTYQEPLHWDWTLTCIRNFSPNKNVLDVGCFRGDFLRKLPPEFEKFGVEPNPQAAEIATNSGIKIIGRDVMDHLAGQEGQFGAIVMMDVAEHVPDPAAVFRHLRTYLAPGGILIVLTGNSDHWLARLSLPFYWYMSFSVHLVHLGKRYFRWVSKTDHWELLQMSSYALWEQDASVRSRERKRGLAVWLWQKCLQKTPLAALLRKFSQIAKVESIRTPPMLYSQRDHVGAVLRKKLSNTSPA